MFVSMFCSDPLVFPQGHWIRERSGLNECLAPPVQRPCRLLPAGPRHRVPAGDELPGRHARPEWGIKFLFGPRAWGCLFAYSSGAELLNRFLLLQFCKVRLEFGTKCVGVGAIAIWIIRNEIP